MVKLTDQEEVRLRKLEEIRELGFTPFLSDRSVDIDLELLNKRYQDLTREQLEGQPKTHQVAGRIMSIRSRFFVIRQEGANLQLYLSDNLEQREQRLAQLLDIGDII